MKTTTTGIYDATGRRKYLTLAEGKRFTEIAARLPLEEATFCAAIYFTGCRISEILSLSFSALDTEAGDLVVQCLKKRDKTIFRRIPLPTSLIEGLKEWSESRPEGKLWTFSRTSGWRIIKKVMAEAKIVGVQATAKGLRHGFGLRCVLSQVPVSMIQRWMGHSFPSTTAIYLEARDEEARKLMERTWE